MWIFFKVCFEITHCINGCGVIIVENPQNKAKDMNVGKKFVRRRDGDWERWDGRVIRI